MTKNVGQVSKANDKEGRKEARKEGRKEAQIGTVSLPKSPVTFLFLHCEERGFGAVYASQGENEKD